MRLEPMQESRLSESDEQSEAEASQTLTPPMDSNPKGDNAETDAGIEALESATQNVSCNGTVDDTYIDAEPTGAEKHNGDDVSQGMTPAAA